MEKLFKLTTLTIQTFDDSGEGRGQLAQIFAFDPRRIKELQKSGAGAYFAINPQEDPNLRGIENTKEFKRIGLDLDVAKEEQNLSKEEIARKKEVLIKKLKTGELLPNYIIETKNGIQPFWEWQSPIPLKTIEDRSKANAYYRRIVAGFGKTTGLKSEGDSITRVLRLPDTLHLKTPNDPFRIKIEKVNPNDTVSFEEFIKTYPPVAEKEYSTGVANNLSEIVAGLSEGGRNVGAAAMVGSLLAKFKPLDWESIVWPLFEAWNEKKNNPPLGLGELAAVFKSIAEKEQSKRKAKVVTGQQSQNADVKNRRFFNPALTIDRERQEVLVGIPQVEPGIDKNKKYRIEETLWIISSKGEKWPLTLEEMDARNTYPRSIPKFGVTETRWSPDFMVTSQNSLKNDQGDQSDHTTAGKVNPFYDVFVPIKQTLESFIEFNNPDYSTLITLWIIGTYIFPIFEAYPYIYLGGIANSGKSKVLEIMYRLAFNPVLSSNASPSSLFRTIENTQSTILVDEGEMLTGREQNPDLRLLFNAGYKATGVVTRTNPESFKVEHFNVYSPKSIAAINPLDRTLETRTIPIIMLRAADKSKGRTKLNDRSADWKGIRDKLYRFLLQHALAVAAVFDKPETETDLTNRNYELFSPLLAIASFVDKYIVNEPQLTPVVLTVAKEMVMEDEALDDWTLWVIEALDDIVVDFRPYLVKEIYQSMKDRKERSHDYLDERLNSNWVGGCLRKLGFKRGKPTNQGKTYFIKRQQVESLKERYELTTPASASMVTMVTKDKIEVKTDGDHATPVTIVSGDDKETPKTLEEALDGLPF